MPAPSPQKELDGFLDKYLPEIADQARACLKIMRKRMPNAVQLVYDNYNALVVGFGPSEKPSEAIFSLVIFPFSLRKIYVYHASPIRSFLCQVIEKRENGTVGYYITVEDSDKSRHHITAAPRQGSAIVIGDIGLAEIKADTLVRFARVDLDPPETRPS